MSEEGSQLTSRKLFAEFGEHFVAGLAPRVEQEVATDGPEIEPSDLAKITAEVADGALLGRTIWGGEGEERTGCFLWTGAVVALLGDDDRKVSELSEEEVSTVDASLKLSIEEGGEKPPFDWSGLEPVGPDDVESKLLESGIAGEFECARLPVTVGERALTFLFLMSTEAQPASEDKAEDAAQAEEARGQYAGTDSGASQDDPVAAATASAVEAAQSTAEPETAEETESASTEETPPAAGKGPLLPENLLNLQHLLDVRLPLTIRLGSTRMPLEELLALTPGAILELDRQEDEPLELLANGQVVGRGEVVVVDERFGLRITEIGSPEDRARATL